MPTVQNVGANHLRVGEHVIPPGAVERISDRELEDWQAQAAHVAAKNLEVIREPVIR